MTGAKTNERPGTRAHLSHSRVSAYKAREILNAIRGMHVVDAADYLDLSERGVSEVIAKVLGSAVSNAEHNDLQDAEELFVSACYADEGPTLKRWRPRARGRATRIRKRTCHITIIVSRLDDDALDIRRNRAERRLAGGSAPKADRAARVAKSRGDDDSDSDSEEEQLGEDVVTDEVVADDAGSDEVAVAEVDEASTDEEAGTGSEEAGTTIDYGEGSHAPLEDDSMPDGFPIKGNADSMKYHQPDGRWYENTVAEVWFADTASAEKAGFIEAGKKAKSSEEEE